MVRSKRGRCPRFERRCISHISNGDNDYGTIQRAALTPVWVAIDVARRVTKYLLNVETDAESDVYRECYAGLREDCVFLSDVIEDV